MMLEAFDCNVTLASNVEQALNEVTYSSVDVVIIGSAFATEHGVQLRTALKATRPNICIAMISHDVKRSLEHPLAGDVFLRPTHFLHGSSAV